jgi:hypothetical protein
MATEGMWIYDEMEGRGQTYPGSGFTVAKRVQDAGAQISMAKDVPAMKKELDFRKEIAAAFGAQ